MEAFVRCDGGVSTPDQPTTHRSGGTSDGVCASVRACVRARYVYVSVAGLPAHTGVQKGSPWLPRDTDPGFQLVGSKIPLRGTGYGDVEDFDTEVQGSVFGRSSTIPKAGGMMMMMMVMIIIFMVLMYPDTQTHAHTYKHTPS